MSYIGNEPIVSATRTVTEITATAGQTVFTANGGYTVGYLDVFLNGAQLQNTDFTATNGSSVTLSQPALAGDDVRLVAWGTFQSANAVALVGNSNLTGNLNVSGTLGIGTTSPNYKLTTLSGAAATIARFGNNNGNTYIETLSGLNRLTSLNAAENASQDFAFNGAGGVEFARITTSGNLQFNSGYGSVATAYGCRAWVNFNGTGTVAIRASGNVSSITDNGAGDYTVNFATAMPDTNYVVTGLGGLSSVTWGFVIPCGLSGLGTTNPNSTTQTRFRTVTPQDGALDNLFCNVAIFR